MTANNRAESETKEMQAGFFAGLIDCLERLPHDKHDEAKALLIAARDERRRVYVFGNGGSASTASHAVCDLAKTARHPASPPIRVFSINDNVPLLTALSNDEGYHSSFSEQIAPLLDPGDVVVAISVSGRSPNVLAGLDTASRAGAHTIALLGCDGGPAEDLADIPVRIDSEDFGLVETAHVAVLHALAEAIRDVPATRAVRGR